MIMKDKLHKNHHKGAYYSIRRFILGTVAFFMLTGAIALPTYIILNRQAETSSKAEEKVEDKKDDEENKNDHILSYYE